MVYIPLRFDYNFIYIMSPIYHENNTSLDSIAQNRVLFPDDGLTNNLRNIKNSLHSYTGGYLTGLHSIRSNLIYFRLQITLKWSNYLDSLQCVALSPQLRIQDKNSVPA
jgi:hypothetical protein